MPHPTQQTSTLGTVAATLSILIAVAGPAASTADVEDASREPIDVMHLAGPVTMLRVDTPIGNPTTIPCRLLSTFGLSVKLPTCSIVLRSMVYQDSVLSQVTKALKKGDSVTLVGFGTFSVSQRKARTGRNPQTGKPIKIKAARVPRFKAGTKLKAFKA